jgi:transposase
MESWVTNWLNKQRSKGEKCLEIKPSHNAHYVYRSTTYWDKQNKKRRKTSSYIGKLDKQKGLIKSTRPLKNLTHPRNIFRYGDAQLLHKALNPLVPMLKNAFKENWEEIYTMALVRINGYVPLKRIKSKWEKLYNPLNITPQLDPKHLSDVLKIVGADRKAQNTLFLDLMKGSSYAYDLSAIFTKSNVNIADLGYNSHKEYTPQVNIVLLSSVDLHLPTMIRVVPGSIKDVSTLKASIADLDLTLITLIMDRGLFSEENIRVMLESNLNFVVPTRRNSSLYDKVQKDLDGHFFYRQRLIKCVKTCYEERFLYLFEDVRLKEEEETTLYGFLDEKKIGEDEFRMGLLKAGRILMVSSLDVDCMRVFEMYKQREEVEGHFDIFKNTLHSDLLYLQDAESIFGHLFVSFLSLYGYCVLQNILRSGGLLDSVSPLDLLEEFSSVYAITDGEKTILTEVPKKVKKLDDRLATDLFPKKS